MTNSCYKCSGSAMKRQDGLANVSCGFNILSLLQKKSLVESPTSPYSKTSLSDVLLPTLLSCSEFPRIAKLKKIFYPPKSMLKY